MQPSVHAREYYRCVYICVYDGVGASIAITSACEWDANDGARDSRASTSTIRIRI